MNKMAITLAIGVTLAGCASKPKPHPPSPVKHQLQSLPIEQRYGIPIYLKNTNGTWTASEVGDINNPNTERVKLFPKADWKADPDFPRGGWDTTCKPGSEVRSSKSGDYNRCNSRLFVNEDGNRILDRSLLERILAQTGAVEMVRGTEPLWQYRARFEGVRNTTNEVAIKAFIDTYSSYDPDHVIKPLQARLTDIERQAMQRRNYAAQEQERIASRQTRREEYVRSLKIGDTVVVKSEPVVKYSEEVRTYVMRSLEYRGLIIDIKGPLLYVQWQNREPRMEWIPASSVSSP
jgi:hypothetical protein